MEDHMPTIIGKAIWWGRPPDGWIKINIDESINKTMKTAGIGSVVRNRNGELITAFAKALQFYTNNQSEVQAALHALQWCKNNNIHNVILEMDSLMVVNIIKDIYNTPWELVDDIRSMRHIIHSQSITVQHCYI
ncbi:uncharacterized protein [Nicotiana tomentosiformis]|uniref:uncharacterized protein n=1 Tax=Nicotiana tomentosiformis TaxID=4098 RepID=UPI00388CECDC